MNPSPPHAAMPCPVKTHPQQSHLTAARSELDAKRGTGNWLAPNPPGRPSQTPRTARVRRARTLPTGWRHTLPCKRERRPPFGLHWPFAGALAGGRLVGGARRGMAWLPTGRLLFPRPMHDRHHARAGVDPRCSCFCVHVWYVCESVWLTCECPCTHVDGGEMAQTGSTGSRGSRGTGAGR